MDLDIKQIQTLLEEGLKTTTGNWEKKRQEDKTAFDEKTAAILATIEGKSYTSLEEVEKAVKASTEALEKEMLVIKKHGISETKPLGFKAAMAKSLKDNYDSISSASKIKGNQVIELKDITNAVNFPGFADWRTDRNNGMITIDRDVFHMRDIIPLGATNSDTIKYPREGAKSGSGPAAWGRAATIAETAAKPSFEPNLSVYSTPVEWIAGIMRLPIEMLADLPFLTSYLQNFAKAELLDAEDDELLNGTGGTPHLDGLIPNATAYNGSYSYILEAIVDANIRQLGSVNTSGTDVVLNYAQIVDIVLNKAAAGAGTYDNPNGVVGYVNGQLTIAGLNVHKTNKIGAGEFLVGNFNHAQIFQRLAPQLRFFEQDQDNVVKNLVTVRIEERIALAILKTTSFVHYTTGT